MSAFTEKLQQVFVDGIDRNDPQHDVLATVAVAMENLADGWRNRGKAGVPSTTDYANVIREEMQRKYLS